MKIKVCGMREVANIEALRALNIDFVGFIFYSQSPRYVQQLPTIDISPRIKRVGVFVNATISEIEQRIEAFALDCIQLHGNESPDFCKQLQQKRIVVLKAFAVDEQFDFDTLKAYEAYCDYFLLDAKGKSYGGNGVQFDWQILEQYTSSKPFFLSGGIGLADIPQVLRLAHPQLYGIDVNSRFEIAPALKDLAQIKELVQQIKE